MSSVILSHPTGNSFVRTMVVSLIEDDMLARFHTTIGSFPGDLLDQMSKINAFSDLRRRHLDSNIRPFTQVWPWREYGRLLASKIGLPTLTKHETGVFSIDAVYQDFDRRVATTLKAELGQGIKAVYAYEDGALSTFKAAKELGLTCIYELPIAYWETGRRLMMEEALRLPDWAQTLDGGVSDSMQKLERKTLELELADLIITPSQFVYESLPAWALSKPVVLSPFGSPSQSLLAGPRVYNSSKPLRVLFVGSMGQRKGLGDLFRAISLLNRPDIELVVLGSPLTTQSFYRRQLRTFTYEPTRPHNQILELMRSCDVFCLPSIVEGRALVMQEAMSQGLPLLITPNTGGSDLVIEGETGFLIPIRSPEIIAEKLTWFLDNRSSIPRMSVLAQNHAALYTWDAYATKIIDTIRKLLAAS